MFNFRSVLATEARGQRRAQDPQQKAKMRVVMLFLVVVLGILASWFWEIGWAYLRNPAGGLIIGPLLAVIVRVVLSFIAAAVTFVTMYNKIDQNTEESWVPYFLAFQNGFFWDAIFQGIAQAANTPTTP